MEHKAVKCDVRGCKFEASRWIDTDALSGDFDMKGKRTFYLCDEHASKLSPEDDYAYFLNPETGRIREIELGVYSCSEECRACN